MPSERDFTLKRDLLFPTKFDPTKNLGISKFEFATSLCWVKSALTQQKFQQLMDILAETVANPVKKKSNHRNRHQKITNFS